MPDTQVVRGTILVLRFPKGETKGIDHYDIAEGLVQALEQDLKNRQFSRIALRDDWKIEVLQVNQEPDPKRVQDVCIVDDLTE